MGKPPESWGPHHLRARNRGCNDLAEPSAEGAADVEESTDEIDDGEAPVDPRYEDLWVQKDDPIQLPDLASIDLDFDEHEE